MSGVDKNSAVWFRRQLDLLREQVNRSGRSITAGMAAVNGRCDELEPRPKCALASGELTTILALGASRDFVIVWPSPMPTASYTVDLVKGSGMLAVGAATVAVVAQDEAGVTVRVTALVALAVGAQFLAHGHA